MFKLIYLNYYKYKLNFFWRSDKEDSDEENLIYRNVFLKNIRHFLGLRLGKFSPEMDDFFGENIQEFVKLWRRKFNFPKYKKKVLF